MLNSETVRLMDSENGSLSVLQTLKQAVNDMFLYIEKSKIPGESYLHSISVYLTVPGVFKFLS